MSQMNLNVSTQCLPSLCILFVMFHTYFNNNTYSLAREETNREGEQGEEVLELIDLGKSQGSICTINYTTHFIILIVLLSEFRLCFNKPETKRSILALLPTWLGLDLFSGWSVPTRNLQ